MKKVLLAGLIGLTMASSVCEASSWKKSGTKDFVKCLLDGDLSVKEVAKIGVDTAVEASATHVAVYGAGALGTEATTGTAIASLSGTAAVSATSYAIGAPVVTALGIAASPAVVGGVIIAGAAGLVAMGINELFFSDDN